tara:strand:- start:100 stop:534 length:435 start_codon:yes stop_codon:yes gene_type:complete
MNSTIYRKIVLVQNWGENKFIMIEETVNVPRCFPCPYSENFQISHPKVSSGEGYWITHNKLCIGYYYDENPEIFRPIFSYTRQKLLDKVHYGKKEEDQVVGNDYSIIKPNLRYARNKYLFGFVRKKKLPIDCIKIILSFIHSKL